MVPKASESRNNSMLNPHSIMRRTRFKLHECRREQRLKNSLVNSGQVDSSISSVSFVEKNISAPLYLPKRNDHGVRSFHQYRSIPAKPISNKTKKSFISRRKSPNFPKHTVSSTTHKRSRSVNSLSTRLYNPRKKSCYEARPFRGQLEGQIGSSLEHKNLSSTFCSKSLNLDKNLKPLFHTPVAPVFHSNRIKRSSDNYLQPSCSLKGTSKPPSSDIQKFIIGFIRNHPTAVNICKSLASSRGRSYSQSLHQPVSHNIPKNHFAFEEQGYIGTISKNTDPASAFAYSFFRIKPNETSNKATNFSRPIYRNSAPNITLKYPSASNEICCSGTISKSINQFSTSSQPFSGTCPKRIFNQMINCSSPCSTVVEVGSRQTTPDSIPSVPPTTDSSPLPRTSQHSSDPIADTSYNSLSYQSTSKGTYFPDGRVYNIKQIYEPSYRNSLTNNFVYPKSVSETNGQNNTSPEEDSSLKSPSLYTSENITTLPSTTEPFLLPGICRQPSEPITQATCNSLASKFICKGSCNNPESSERFNQICSQCVNLHRLPFMGNFICPSSISKENAKCHNSPCVNNPSKWLSLDPHQKRLYSSQLQRTPPPNASTFPWALCPGSNIQDVNRSVNQPCFYDAVLYNRPITRSSNNSEEAHLFSEPNYAIGFLAQPNTYNPQSTSEESCFTENIVRSISQYFDFLPRTGTTEPSEVSLSSNESNSEYSDHTDQGRNKTKISKLISCFTACFRPSCPQQEHQT